MPDLNLSTLVMGADRLRPAPSAVGLGVRPSPRNSRRVPDLSPVARLALDWWPSRTASSIQDPEYRLLILFLVVFLRSRPRGRCGGPRRLRRWPPAWRASTSCVEFSLRLHVPGDSPRWSRRLACDVPTVAVARPRRDDPRRRWKLPGWLDPASKGVLTMSGTRSPRGLGDESGYSSAMSFSTERWWIDAGIFLVWFALLVLWLIWWPTPRNRIALVGLALPLFAAWKHSMVRQDEHVAILARFGLFVTVVLLVESARFWRSRYTLPAAVLALLVVFPWDDVEPARVRGHGKRDGGQPGRVSRGEGSRPGGWSRVYRDTVGRVSWSALAERVLPEARQRRIAGRTVGNVYLWETSYVAATGSGGPTVRYRLFQWMHRGARWAQCRLLSGARPTRVRGVARRLPGGLGEHRRETPALG